MVCPSAFENTDGLQKTFIEAKADTGERMSKHFIMVTMTERKGNFFNVENRRESSPNLPSQGVMV